MMDKGYPELRRYCAFLVAALSSIAMALPVQGAAVSSPFAYAVPRQGATSAESRRCPPMVTPMVDMAHIGTFYKATATQSVIDRTAMRAYVQRVASSDRMAKEVLQRHRALIDGTGDRVHVAACLQKEIASWARAGALLGNLDQNDAMGHRQAVLILIWTGIATASAYSAASAYTVAQPDDDAAVRAWLTRASDTIRQEFTPRADRPAKERWLDMTANHSHFAGAAVGIIAGVTQDRTALDWMRRELGRALAAAQTDGALPAEMRRGGRSLHYQSFALLAISLMVSVADANGLALDPDEERRLSTIADFTLRAYQEPSLIGQRVGAPQEKARTQAAWMAVLAPHFNRSDPALRLRLARQTDDVGPVDVPLVGLPASASERLQRR